jgi:hypothetical protein
MFTRRLGPNGQTTLCAGGAKCPDILEMESGDFAIIGTDITREALDSLPAGSGCGPDERVVRIPRKTLILARSDIPPVL